MLDKKSEERYLALCQAVPLRIPSSPEEARDLVRTARSLARKKDRGGADVVYASAATELVDAYRTVALMRCGCSDDEVLRILMACQDVDAPDVSQTSGVSVRRLYRVLAGECRLTREEVSAVCYALAAEPDVFDDSENLLRPTRRRFKVIASTSFYEVFDVETKRTAFLCRPADGFEVRDADGASYRLDSDCFAFTNRVESELDRDHDETLSRYFVPQPEEAGASS